MVLIEAVRGEELRDEGAGGLSPLVSLPLRVFYLFRSGNLCKCCARDLIGKFVPPGNLFTGKYVHRESCSSGKTFTGKDVHRESCSSGKLFIGKDVHREIRSSGKSFTGKVGYQAICLTGFRSFSH